MKPAPLARMLLVMVAFLFLSGCEAVPKADVKENTRKISANASFNKEAVKDSIEAANAVFVAAVLRGDSTTAGNGYTTDAKIMEPHHPSKVGRDAIISTIAKGEYAKNGIKEFEVRTIDIWGVTDLVIEEGTWRLKDGQGKTIDNGKYIGIWKQEDGKWKIFRDIGNSDNPPKPADTIKK